MRKLGFLLMAPAALVFLVCLAGLLPAMGMLLFWLRPGKLPDEDWDQILAEGEAKHA